MLKRRLKIISGCVGEGGHPDYPDHPQQRDHEEPQDLPVEARGEQVVPPPQQRPGERPGLVHVSDQHGPDGAQVGTNQKTVLSRV